jgi:hypothetical protein
MKNFIRWTLALAAAGFAAQWNSTALAQFPGPQARANVVLTIHADGRCEIENVDVISRPAAEQQVRMMERMQNMDESDVDVDIPPLPIPKPEANANALTDEQLKEKFTQMMARGMGFRDEEQGGESVVTVDKENVTLTKKSSFASIQEMLQRHPWLVEQQPFSFENTRIEQDTNGHLLVTLTPSGVVKRMFKSMRAEWKM